MSTSHTDRYRVGWFLWLKLPTIFLCNNSRFIIFINLPLIKLATFSVTFMNYSLLLTCYFVWRLFCFLFKSIQGIVFMRSVWCWCGKPFRHGFCVCFFNAMDFDWTYTFSSKYIIQIFMCYTMKKLNDSPLLSAIFFCNIFLTKCFIDIWFSIYGFFLFTFSIKQKDPILFPRKNNVNETRWKWLLSLRASSKFQVKLWLFS